LESFRQKQKNLEGDMIRQALKEEGGNRSLAARSLGWCRKTLYNKLKEHGIEE
jgi:DNA-binding NtrC family response regulator